MIVSKGNVLEGYKETELGEIPVSWEVKSVGEVFQLIGGMPLSRAKTGDGDILYLHYGDIHRSSKSIFSTSSSLHSKIDSAKIKIKDEALLKSGDIVFADASEDYADIGKNVLVKIEEDKKFVAGLHTIVARDINNLMHESYKAYVFKTPDVKKQLAVLANGSTVLGISKSNLEKVKFLIPPMQEQQKIAKILLAADEQLEKTQQLIEKAQELKKALIQQLLTKGIGHTEFKKTSVGEIPVKWDIDKLENLTLKITDGAHHRPTYLEDGIPFLRVTDIQTREIHWNETKKISVEEHNSLIKRCNPEKGDILLSKNGTIGLTKLIDWENDFSIFVSLCLVKIHKSNSRILPEFLIPFFESSICQKQFKDSSKQGTVTNLHLVEIRKLIIPIPPIEEQKKISDILASMNGQIKTYENEKEKQVELKKALMQQLLTGKIRVTV